jgi:hypothetical protein
VLRDAKDTLWQYAGLPVGNLNLAGIERNAEIAAAIEASEKASRERRKKEIAERAR